MYFLMIFFSFFARVRACFMSRTGVLRKIWMHTVQDQLMEYHTEQFNAIGPTIVIEIAIYVFVVAALSASQDVRAYTYQSIPQTGCVLVWINVQK